jgi:predicted nucleic acid-binding protein
MAQRAYIDSSVVLRILLPQSGAIPDLTRWQIFSSRLLDVEVRRTLLRHHTERVLSSASFARRLNEWTAIRDSMDLIPISEGIMQRAAEPFPTLLKTLDAIHLATALGWSAQTQEPVTILTHDRQFGIAASACGFPIVP